jgi:hypothetical protein
METQEKETVEEIHMGSFGDYLEKKLLDHFFGKAAYTAPIIYLALSTADPGDDGSTIAEPSSGGYARKSTAASDWNAATLGAGATDNAADISFAESSGAWAAGANLTHFALFDDPTAGNFLGWGVLTTPRAVAAAGVILKFAAGDLDVSLD